MHIRSMTVFAVLAAALFVSCRSVPQNQDITLAEDFPFDPARRHERNFAATGRLEQLSENLFLFEDCCNVYVVKEGDRALLVDFGSGEILKLLPGIGVKEVERVLVTHHHRDQVQGLCDLKDYGFKVSVPAAEAHFFEDVESFWRDVKIYINYNCRSHWNTIRESIRVDEKVRGGDIVRWNGIEFEVIDTPGSTGGAVSYAAVVDGKKVVFSGDLIAAAGKVTNWFDLHWNYYGFTQGIDASDASFERVGALGPEILLPSHGHPVADPEKAMAENSRIYETLRDMLLPNELHRQMHYVREILPHLVFIGMNCYGIVSESGKAFLWDYGYVNRESLAEFKKKFNVDKVEAVSFSHYHDDHNIRAYELLHEDSEIWVFENMLDVFQNPAGYKLPCLVPFPIMADRVIQHGEKIQWEEYELEFFRMPGQTQFHCGLKTMIDGRKVMFTGDNTWKKAEPEKFRNGPVVPHNEYFLDGGFITCAELMLQYLPDIVCPAHTEEYSPTEEDLEEFLGWAHRLREVMTGLIDQPDPNFGMDYRWCRFYPYRSVPAADEPFEVRLMIRNHLFNTAEIEVALKYPESLACTKPVRKFTVQGKKQVAVPFVLSRTAASAGRAVITADITINGHRIGEYTEGLIDF